MKEHNNYLVLFERNLPFEWSEAVIFIENDYLNVNNIFYNSDDHEINLFTVPREEYTSAIEVFEKASVNIVKLIYRKRDKKDLVITYYLNFYDEDSITITKAGKLIELMDYMESINLHFSEIHRIIKFSEGFINFLKKSTKNSMNEMVVDKMIGSTRIRKY